MSKNGYIRIPRSLFASKEWTEKRVFSKFEAILSLLEQASYVDGRMLHFGDTDLILRRGQLATTLRTLAGIWGWNAATVLRFLHKLRNSYQDTIRINVETIKNTMGTIITICNYDCSDDFITVGETAFETAFETTPATYNNKGEEIKDIKNDRITPPDELVKNFIRACARSETRETARQLIAPLLASGFLQTEVWNKTAQKGSKLLVMVWSYYPNLQMEFSEPLLRRQANMIAHKYAADDIVRVIERMANTVGLTQKKKSFYSTLCHWLDTDYERLNRIKKQKQ
mgnify:CR=1 FL=1